MVLSHENIQLLEAMTYRHPQWEQISIFRFQFIHSLAVFRYRVLSLAQYGDKFQGSLDP